MTKQILRVIAGGILAGTLIYFFPFILPAIGIFIAMGFILHLIFGTNRKWSRNHFAEKMKNLSSEERKAFIEKYQHSCLGKEMRTAEIKTETQMHSSEIN